MTIKKWSGTAWVDQYVTTNVSSIVASGTPSSSNFLRGDGQWIVPTDTNNFVSSATFASNTLTLNRQGLTALTVDLSSLATDANNFLTGVSGSGNGTVTFTRSGLTNLTWNAAHTHAISNVTGLQDALNAKVAKAGDTMTGVLKVSASTVVGNAFVPTTLNETNKLNILSGSTSNGGINGIKFHENTDGFGMSFGYDGTGSGPANKLAWYTNTNAQIMELLNDVSNTSLKINGNIVFNDGYHPNADTLTTARTINGVSFNGSANITITADPNTHTHVKADITDFAHTHAIADVTGLQDALNAKAPLASPTFTGNVTAPNVLVGEYIYHSGDTNTYIRFLSSDDMQLMAGGRQMLRMDEGTDPDRLRFVTDDNWTDSSGNWNMSGSLTVGGNIAVSGTVDGVDIAALNTTVSLKANLASPALTGIPTAPTASFATNTTQLATTAFVQTALSGLVASAPETLDTLNELAAALGDDPNFATTVANDIGTKVTANTAITAGTATKITYDTKGLVTGGTTLAAGDLPTHTHSIANVTGLQTALDGKLGTGAKAADSNLLDGIDSSAFLRSNTADTASGKITFATGLARSAHNTGHLEGSYNNIGDNGTQSNPIYTIGSSYNPATTTLDNMYGIGYTFSTASFINFTGESGWGLYVAADGDARVWLSGSNGVISSTGEHYVGSSRVFHDTYHPNADKLTTARNIALAGAVTGSANFDGSGNISITTTATSDPVLTLTGDATGSATFTNLGNATLTVAIVDDSHNHIISNVDGLQSALDLKLNTSLKGANSGLAELDSSGKVPASQLPSYVDDVVMFDPLYNTVKFSSTNPTGSTAGSLNEILYSFESNLYYCCSVVNPPTGYVWTSFGGGGTIPADGFETGKIYVTTTSNKTYRWGSGLPKSGSIVEISASLALGSTSATAHRGDHGATAYTHSQVTNGTNPHGTTFANIASKPTTLSGFGITDAEPAFTKNTGFNKNFGTTSGTVAQGNDARFTDARTPTAHTHGNITNAGAIGSTTNLVVVTGTSGVLTTSSRSGIDSRSSFPPAGHAISTHSDVSISSPTSGQVLKWNGVAWTNQADTNTNNYLTGVSGSGNGTVSFTRTGLSTLTWNAAHTHSNYLPIPGSPYYSPTTNSILKFNTTYGWLTTAKQYDWQLIRNHTNTFTLDDTGALGLTGGTAGVTVSLAAGDVLMMELSPYSSVIAGYTVPIVTVRLGGTDTTPTSLQQGTQIKFERFSSTTRYHFSTKVSGSGTTIYFDDTFRMQFLDTSSALSIMTEANSNLYIGKVWRLTI